MVVMGIRWQPFILTGSAPNHVTDMPNDPPSHVIPLFPLEIRRAKVHLNLVRAVETNCGVYVIVHTGHVDPHEGVRQAMAVVGEEECAGPELVSASDDIAWGNSRKPWRVVVATAVRILKKFAQIVKVESGAEAIPSGHAPTWVWFACRTCVCMYELNAPMVMTPSIMFTRTS